MLHIKKTRQKGRGVFTDEKIQKGQTIEKAPVIVIPEEEVVHIRRSIFQHYYFKWGKERKDGAIALGYGSLYNHSFSPNATFELDLEAQLITFVALRDIVPEEEIRVNYNGDPANRSRLWFEVVES